MLPRRQKRKAEKGSTGRESLHGSKKDSRPPTRLRPHLRSVALWSIPLASRPFGDELLDLLADRRPLLRLRFRDRVGLRLLDAGDHLPAHGREVLVPLLGRRPQQRHQRLGPGPEPAGGPHRRVHRTPVRPGPEQLLQVRQDFFGRRAGPEPASARRQLRVEWNGSMKEGKHVRHRHRSRSDLATLRRRPAGAQGPVGPRARGFHSGGARCPAARGAIAVHRRGNGGTPEGAQNRPAAERHLPRSRGPGMNYEVVWDDRSENELATAWLEFPDRNAITRAAEWLDRHLANDPLGLGIPRSSSVHRVAFRTPLGVEYEVIEDDKKVIVRGVFIAS